MIVRRQRLIGAVVASVAALVLVIAVLVQPVADWGKGGFVLGAVYMIFLLVGLYTAVKWNGPFITGGGQLAIGTPRSTLFACVLTGVMLGFIVFSGVGDGWTASTVFMLGIFVASELALIGMLIAMRAE